MKRKKSVNMAISHYKVESVTGSIQQPNQFSSNTIWLIPAQHSRAQMIVVVSLSPNLWLKIPSLITFRSHNGLANQRRSVGRSSSGPSFVLPSVSAFQGIRERPLFVEKSSRRTHRTLVHLPTRICGHVSARQQNLNYGNGRLHDRSYFDHQTHG